MQKFLDSVTLAGVKVTGEGYLIADAFTVRTGIQNYAGYEVGRHDMSVVRVYRPESEVFSADTLRSFSHVPVTNDHPSVPVTADNWKDYAVGEASTEVLRDGERMRIPLVLKDKSAIADVQAGKRELSAGYACDLDFTAGTTPEGMAYDAVQRNIRANHVAVVQRGRAGSEFRIGDAEPANWGIAPIVTDRESPMTTRTILVDGISILTTDQGAQAIEKLQKALGDNAVVVAAHVATIAAKDAEIGELKIKVKDADDKLPTGAILDKLVADRAELVDSAKKIAKDAKFEGLSDADIRREAVKAAYGEEMVKDASDEMVSGMFRAAAKDAANKKVDPVAQALQARDNKAPTQVVADHGQQAYNDRISNAWKGK